CSRDDGTPAAQLKVFAASSLTDAFTELGRAFEASHPDIEVTFNFAASSALATQISEGTPADVFAAADTVSMGRVVSDGGSTGEPLVFATNTAQIIVGPGNPQGITSLDDLTDSGLIVIACDPEVPCGRYAQQILAAAGLEVTFRSFEENARAVTSKVVLGEADAGIVYRTDVVAAASNAAAVDIPTDVNVVAEYPIAVTPQSSDPDAARAFVDFVRSPQGQAILASFGFGPP
ncbi:MAG: molybdate ABC transporter substrate-binding protein, partial [Ilumatobacteraceae bacterium]